MADKQTLANFVDGAFVPPAEGGYTDVVNPATGEVYVAAPLSTAPDLDAAFAAAERAFGEWGRTTSEEIPPMVDQIRFFAGAARVLEGKAGAEYMRGFQSSICREPVGVVGSVAPWN